ncbi:hypothetical protein ACR2WA_25435, partial [Klebsiella pneumoniae]
VEEEEDGASEESYEEDGPEESYEEEDSVESDVYEGSPENDFDEGIMEEEERSEEDYPLEGAVTDDWLWNDQFSTPSPTGVPDYFGQEGDYEVEDMLEEEIEEEEEEEEVLEAEGEALEEAFEDLEDAIGEEPDRMPEPPKPVYDKRARNRQGKSDATVARGTTFFSLIIALGLCLM